MSASAARALKQLQVSMLFDADFPRRVSYTEPQYGALMEARADNLHQPGLEAIERARTQYADLEALVATLGRERYDPAVPTLARLWRECALQPVWVKVGHALFEIATPNALEALRSLTEDHENFAQHMAFKAVFVRGSTEAFDHFDRLYSISRGEHWLLPHLLYFLHTGGIGVDPEHMLDDARWLDLCARFRAHPTVGHPAREVLRVASAADRDAAIQRAKALEKPLVVNANRDGSLLKRYRSGEFEQVWREIRTHEHIDGEFRDEVIEVAEATMQRVAQNADLIAERLRTLGWQALSPDDLRTVPKSGDRELIARVEELSSAPLPPTLLAFWRVVGGINWVWDYNAPSEQPDLGFDLPSEEHDVLCVYSPIIVTEMYDEWIDRQQEVRETPELAGPLRIDLAPDYLHKANISGGSPYCIELPYLGVDPLFADERHRLPFLDYLRLAFRWSGFPGLDRHANRTDVREFVARLGRGLAPF